VSRLALVPVKAGGTGKQRLAHSLTQVQRAELIRLMLGEVLSALTATPAIDEVLVLSHERGDVPSSIEVVGDPGCGLNGSLQGMLPSLAARGATQLTILFADLPLASAADVTALLGAAGDDIVALAPDHAGTGTNALTLPLPTSFQLKFGPGSFVAHLEEAARVGLTVATVRRAGLACDIDEPADLEALRKRCDPRYAFLG
jgi:2-phospho-L-lactate/phosphoenolpyruvate guanylyltransferase